MDLKGKKVVVTGANGSLGRSVVACAENPGAQVYKVDLDKKINRIRMPLH
jgi:NAD(P)-dependent dehydrogenase (short-subunit alcohol dehydrogenase family)